MKTPRKCAVLLALTVMLLTGCWDQRNFEQSGLLLTVGLEESTEDNMLVTSVYPVIGGKENNQLDIIHENAPLMRAAREYGRHTSAFYIDASKVQELLVSDSLAATGIHDLLEIYQRDPSNPAIAYLVVVDGSPSELIDKATEFKGKPNVSIYIHQLIENNVRMSNTPNTKVFDFDINFFAPGVDPITPMIKLEDDVVAITGCALFSSDKMVGKLDHDQTIMLLSMMSQLKRTDYIFDTKELPSRNERKYGIAALLRRPKRTLKFDFDEEGKPIIDISLNYEAVLDEYEWDKTTDEAEQKRIEGIMSKDLTAVCNKTIKYMQEVNCDAIGLGNLIRAKFNDYWSSIDWNEMYKEADIKVMVKVDIVKEGIIK